MYHFFALLTGFLIAVMIVINGELNAHYGLWAASLIIHIAGLITVLAVWLFKREPLKPRAKIPLYYFLGGVIGVATTAFNNLAFGKISVSAITGLGLLGQSITAIVIDHFGLLGMEKQRFARLKLIGLAFIAAGILFMFIF